MGKIRLANVLILALILSGAQLAHGADKKDVDELQTCKPGDCAFREYFVQVYSNTTQPGFTFR